MELLYAALAAVGFVASQVVLLEWVGEFNAKYDSDNDGEFTMSGIWLIDMLLQFFDDASNNYAAVRLYDTVWVLAGSMTFAFVAEASRRQANVPHALVGSVLLLGQLLGVGAVIPAFLFVLHFRGIKTMPADNIAAFDLDAMRAIYLVMCNILFIVFGLVAVPYTSTAWPGGSLNKPIVFSALFVPAIPILAFACDKTASNTLWDDPKRTPHNQVKESDIAHYTVMLNCGISGAVGLLVHLRVIYTWVFTYDFSIHQMWSDAVSTGPGQFLAVDLLFLLVAGYCWLQFESKTPIDAYFNKAPNSLLSWRDLLALLFFGPTTHFNIAFASREFTLMRIDAMREKVR